MDVFNEFWCTNQNQSLGPDGISAKFLKESSFILSPIISNKSLITNYRPISKISIIPKIFSKLVNNKIFPLCENILSNEQHGFRPGRSTITNLTYGFYNPLLSWIHSFLTNRTQAVKYENYISDQINILSGVPQGDHLSPLLLPLFSIFINYINTILKHSSCLFLLADDTKIYKNIKCTNDALELQSFINVLFSLKKNTLLFDYILNNSILTRNYVIKDLSVFFDTKLSFNFHVNYIRNKSYKKLGLVKRMCKDFYDESALKI
ncbi:Reverse transcriptase domain-containing protein, partial [Aphis craccivora]